MRILILVLGVMLMLASSSPAAATTVTPGAGRAQLHAPSGPTLAQKMLQQLRNQSRVEVRGTERDARGRSAQFLFRFQASDRELIRETGGAFTHVQIGKGQSATVSFVTVGTTRYRSIDGKHWSRTPLAAPPSSTDALRFNSAGVSCCNTWGRKSHGSVKYGGAGTWHHTHVYRLRFVRVANGVYVAGTLLVDARSYRPLQYWVTSSPPTVTGSFGFSYGGSFTISAPA